MLKNFVMENITVIISPSPSKQVIIGATVHVTVQEWTQLHVRPYRQAVRSNSLHVSHQLSFCLQRAGGHRGLLHKRKSLEKSEIHCQPLCSQPMRNSIAQLCFNQPLQCQKSLKLQLIESNCNTRISCFFVQIHLLPNFM